MDFFHKKKIFFLVCWWWLDTTATVALTLLMERREKNKQKKGVRIFDGNQNKGKQNKNLQLNRHVGNHHVVDEGRHLRLLLMRKWEGKNYERMKEVI